MSELGPALPGDEAGRPNKLYLLLLLIYSVFLCSGKLLANMRANNIYIFIYFLYCRESLRDEEKQQHPSHETTFATSSMLLSPPVISTSFRAPLTSSTPMVATMSPMAQKSKQSNKHRRNLIFQGSLTR